MLSYHYYQARDTTDRTLITIRPSTHPNSRRRRLAGVANAAATKQQQHITHIQTVVSSLLPVLNINKSLQPTVSNSTLLLYPIADRPSTTPPALELLSARHLFNMILRRKAQSGKTCSSAGRVTSQVLLSFLALAASPVTRASNVRSNDEALLPLPPSSLFVPTPEPPPPAEHTFVSPGRLALPVI